TDALATTRAGKGDHGQTPGLLRAATTPSPASGGKGRSAIILHRQRAASANQKKRRTVPRAVPFSELLPSWRRLRIGTADVSASILNSALCTLLTWSPSDEPPAGEPRHPGRPGWVSQGRRGRSDQEAVRQRQRGPPQRSQGTERAGQ